MSREVGSPELGNLIAARLTSDRFEERLRAPLTDSEKEDAAELVEWFTRRYPTAKERFAYARRKLREALMTRGTLPCADYLATAKRLSRAHRQNDPGTVDVLLAPDPEQREIRLVEVTRSAPPSEDPTAVRFIARPDLGVPHPSAVLLLSPEDWLRVRRGELPLEDGWELDHLVSI